MIGIVVSRADSASQHIGEQLLATAEWSEHEDAGSHDGSGTYYRREGFELREFEEMHLSLERPADAFETEPDLLVFVSRHAGETGPLLTAHFTGNFGPAEYGGAPGSFARACPGAQKEVVAALAEHAPETYQVGVECTHHGPTAVGVPSMFVELGSAEPQWTDPEGAGAVAEAVLTLDGVGVDNRVAGASDAEDEQADASDRVPRQLVGFGGGHYAPRFERIVRETPWAVGHVGADWALDAMGAPEENREVIRRAFECSNARYAVLEQDRPELAAVIDELGYRAVSETWVREVGDRPLGVVEALEDALSTVEAGLRFGDRAVEGGSEVDSAASFVVVDLPGELLSKVQGIDADAARDAVRNHTVAFETEQGASRAAGRAAVPTTAARDALIDALVTTLESAYDQVERRDGVVVAREQGFDPEKAHTLGVPEGPKFGRLAVGQSVEVDGEQIAPADVQSERVDRFET